MCEIPVYRAQQRLINPLETVGKARNVMLKHSAAVFL